MNLVQLNQNLMELVMWKGSVRGITLRFEHSPVRAFLQHPDNCGEGDKNLTAQVKLNAAFIMLYKNI